MNHIYFLENDDLVPFNRQSHPTKVCIFIGFMLFAEKKRLFIAGGKNVTHAMLTAVAEKNFSHVVNPPFLAGTAFNGCLLNDKDVCFTHDSFDGFFHQKKLEFKKETVVEIFGLKDITSPNSIES